MARTPLRPDIAVARMNARFSLGSGRELGRLEDLLTGDETVEAMVQGRSQGCFGLLVLTDARLLFVCDGIIWKVNDDVALARISLVQWQTVFGFGALTVHVAGTALQFTGLTGPGGTAILRGLRESLAEKDQLERQVREGLIALAAHFKPDPLPDSVPADLAGAGHEFAANV
ncbi:hypothetical protein IV500_05980 [Paeniglutamicibacter antarcticus]|uniref:YokE-like PH domain-containing protein n=1 Tax=Arthrobacter terrae TaxID=2935737 RepID=A0A931G3R8_9MICC|nr:PH domain-containing protein [Arthrobacter terrae]MBG0738971.1 hypothetical protein [Arthrobacter terrae]